MEIAVTDPSIVAIYFFKKEEHGEQARTLFGRLVTSQELNLQKLVEEEGFIVYANEEKNYWLDWLTLHDVIAVRLFLAEEGQGSLASWKDLRALVDSATGSIHNQPSREIMLGASLLYWGSVASGITENIKSSHIEKALAIKEGLPAPPSQLEYGPMWKLTAWGEPPLVDEYALLCVLPLTEQAKRDFIFARNFGFLRLEFHLHRAYDWIVAHEEIREPLLDLAGTLENDSAALLNLLRTGSLKAQEQALRRASVTYGELMRMMSQAYTLAAGLRANVERYEWHLERIPKQSAQSAEADLGRFQLSIRQVGLDMDYCESTARGVQTSISLLRTQFDASSARREGLIVIVLAVFAAVIAVGEIVGQVTADWRIIAVSMVGVAVLGLGAWLLWRLFRRAKRQR